MATSNDQVARLLLLVPYLQAHPGVPIATVAATFGVSSKQVRSDLDVLWMCGLPGGLPGDLIEIDMDAVEGEGTITLSNAEYLARPMRFTLDEALSLVLGLRAVHDLVGPELRPAVESALARFEGLLTPEARDTVQVQVNSGEQDVRDALASAITDRHRVRLTYDGLARGETTRPLVDPATIAVRDGYAYLDAFSLDRDAWRTFRLDRIAAVEVLEEAIEPHPEPPGDFSSRLAVADVVRLHVDRSAGWVTEYYPCTVVSEQPDHLVADVAVADPAWLRSLLLRLGAAISVISPAGAEEPARAAAREALALYAD